MASDLEVLRVKLALAEHVRDEAVAERDRLRAVVQGVERILSTHAALPDPDVGVSLLALVAERDRLRAVVDETATTLAVLADHFAEGMSDDARTLLNEALRRAVEGEVPR